MTLRSLGIRSYKNMEDVEEIHLLKPREVLYKTIHDSKTSYCYSPGDLLLPYFAQYIFTRLPMDNLF